MKKVSILIVLVLGCFIESKAQKVALKSNCAIGEYSRKSATGFVRSSDVRSSECMDIMRTSMSVGSRTGRLLVRICRTAAIRDICMAGGFPSGIHGF